jgi:3-oxoacyl-[acyl-carrier protein] reductase
MKTVIVTGGSRGIGAAIVVELAKNNYNVVLNYNNSEEKAKKIQKDLKEQGINIEIFKADVSKREDVKKLVSFTIEKYNNIDILINNAGIDQIKPFMDITNEDWNKIIQTNLNSVFYCSQEVLKNMIHNKKGCIINISSIWGITGASCEVAYSVSKAGIDGMTKALAKEMGLSNIRVNSIAPGIVDTDMNKELSFEELQELKNEIPLGRIATPEEIVKSVKWLIDDEYVTGQIISVNGGWNI